MTSQQLPSPIGEFIDSTNRADTDAFVATFADDAYLNDWGREFRGHDGVREWNRTDNIGMQSKFELVGIEPGDGGGVYVVTMKVAGNRFNGTGTMTMTLRDDLIASLVIS